MTHRSRSIAFAVWGVLPLGLMLLECIVRLGHRALLAVASGLEIREVFGLALSLAVFGYGEGYLALHKRFVPRVVARAFAPAGGVSLGVAPLYVMGLVGDDRRQVFRGWLGVAGIVCAILVVRALPSPFREIVDAGVASALGLGLVSTSLRFAAAVRSSRCPSTGT